MRGESANIEVLFLAWSPKSLFSGSLSCKNAMTAQPRAAEDNQTIFTDGTGTLTGRHHKNRSYFIVRINPGTKKLGFQMMHYD